MNISVGTIRYVNSHIANGWIVVTEDNGQTITLGRPSEAQARVAGLCIESDCDCDTEENRDVVRWAKALQVMHEVHPYLRDRWTSLDEAIVDKYEQLTRDPKFAVADAELKTWVQDNVEVDLLAWFGHPDTTEAERALGFASQVAESQSRFEAMTEQVVRIAELDMMLQDAKAGQGITALEEQVRVLTNQLEQRTEDRDRIRTRYHHDMDLVGSELMQQAINRNWCGQYDDFVNELNSSLHYELPTRSQDYTVSVTVTFSVNSSDGDSASSEADEMMRSIERRSDYHFSWDITDVELDD